MTREEFESWLEGKRTYWERHATAKHEFDESDLSAQFVPHFRSGQRVRVRMASGLEVTGMVGATTGWKPSFMLLRSSASTGSSTLLGDEDQVIAVQRPSGGKYVPIQTEAKA